MVKKILIRKISKLALKIPAFWLRLGALGVLFGCMNGERDIGCDKNIRTMNLMLMKDYYGASTMPHSFTSPKRCVSSILQSF